MSPQRNSGVLHAGRGAGPAHQHRAVKGRVRDQQWPGTLMGLGIFVALGTLFTVVPWTLMDPDVLFRVFLGFCFGGNIIGYARSGLRLGMERLEWFLFNLLAVGPILTSLLLWTNYLGHGPVQVTDHDVRKVEQVNGVLFYEFRDDLLAAYPFARASHRDSYAIVGDRIHVSLADGLFGIPVVVRKEPFVSGP